VEQQQQPKRSFFVPALLLLIVISVTVNVILYSKSLSRLQEDRVQRGLAIVDMGNNTKLHFQAVHAGVRALLASGDIASRLAAKSEVAAAFHNAADVASFLKEVETTSGTPNVVTNRDAATFTSQVEQSLQQLGNHEGALTEMERQYLQELDAVYSKLMEASDPIDFGEVTKPTAMTIQAGGKWVEIGTQLIGIMNEPENVVFSSGK